MYSFDSTVFHSTLVMTVMVFIMLLCLHRCQAIMLKQSIAHTYILIFILLTYFSRIMQVAHRVYSGSISRTTKGERMQKADVHYRVQLKDHR